MEAAGVGNTIATRGLVWRPHCLHFCYITLVREASPRKCLEAMDIFCTGTGEGGAGGLNPMP